MDASSAYLALALTASFGAAFSGAMVVEGAVYERERSSRAYGRAVSASRIDALLRNGIQPLVPLAKRLLRVRAVERWAASLQGAMALRGRESSPASICSIAIAACAFLAMAGYAAGSWAAAIAVPCGALMLATARCNQAREKHADLMRDQLPDALRAMSACFHAGLSLNQTFGQLSHEVPAPLGAVFQKASQRLQMGSTVAQALKAMRGESGLSELSFLSVALQVQHQAGGSMQHVLDATGDALEGELDLKRSLRVQTAQARLSARVVVGVTVLLVIVLSVLSDDFLAAFFQSAMGTVLLCIAVGMQVAGILLVRRLLNVQVD